MVRATSYFSPIDHDKTIENAKEVLGNYWHHKRLAQRTKTALRSPVMDGMPKSPSYGNKAEEKVISHSDELRYVACCEIAVRSVELEKYRIILTETYLVSLDQRKPWWLIAEELHLSKSAYYRDFKEALLAFADWCELVEQPHKT
ncbi:ArpU family phage packaging/lysis transcriptional regulator [Lacticaseibacillus paracasei]|uniref:ArpU family phage packaging/lysis transcriptional regulator n=1 Tax=Lacticaseibacillus paracasei TaxID=1597 RepID=UPI001891A763|nr:ArpU family phage packaging/lysis transcriptional regulator [Lacticaseibacillus paracasei]QPB57167.1 transcriptional regulator [Lacticaseibacillus paracasei]WPQ29491.1 ArpU family phage packaging/lysis transcriptional regulator [Lacticaseibacillus paracasei]